MALSILVVDDSVTVRSVIAKTLEMARIPVAKLHQAADGQEALDLLDREWIDLVFADIHMPRMTGIEMVEKMAGNKMLESIPVVIVSSDGSSDRIEHLKSQGVRGYIRKPFTPEQMREVVRDLMGVQADE